jgi:hypothetical protein
MDESYEEEKSDVICIAGYVFRELRAKEFGGLWRPYLARKKLPYFHMSECAHGRGVFEGRDDCDEVERKLIELTRKYTALGFAVTVSQGDFESHLEGRYQLRSAYSFALFIGDGHRSPMDDRY